MNGNNLGPLTPYHPPSLGALKSYNVNRPGQVEVIWQPTYDFQVYPAAGTTQLTFFQTTVGTAGSTLATTNMEASGQFPRPKEFLVTGIQVFFEPGGAVAQAGVSDGDAQENWNDVSDVMNGAAFLRFFIGSKDYLVDTPLSKFTQQFRLGGVANITGNGSVATTTFIDYAVHSGKYYSITPTKLPSNQNFNVSLNFPVVIATAQDANIGVLLDGFQYRLSQ
jgi:hypothetical protein